MKKFLTKSIFKSARQLFLTVYKWSTTAKKAYILFSHSW